MYTQNPVCNSSTGYLIVILYDFLVPVWFDVFVYAKLYSVDG